MDKRIAIECIKLFENIKFSEQIEGSNTIGYINYANKQIKVLYHEDNLGKYISLVYLIENITNTDIISNRLSKWIINGRYEVEDDKIFLWSICPILDEQFLGKQIQHALTEIWDMTNIVKNASV